MKKLENIFATLGGATKIVVFLVAVVVMVPVAWAFKRYRPEQPFFIPRLFHSFLCRLLDLRVRVVGAPALAKPLLFVANHASYLDILVLGSVLPAGFVAKSEVAKWPLFGFLARMQNTVFIERKSTRAAAQQTQLHNHLATHQNLILFPEGTSSDGLTALPFKSTLFGIVEDSAPDVAITIQPVSVTCVELNGFPLLREERALYAWYGDMTLPPHLWNVFKHGGFTIEVVFHAPLTPAHDANRKELAAQCQAVVAKGIEQSLAHQSLLAKEVS